MIRTRKELSFYLQADRMMNRGSFETSFRTKLHHLLFPDYIMSFLVHMRKAEYYSHQKGVFNKMLSGYHRFKQRKLGMKLGFTIAKDVFGYGLVIPHYGTIVIGGGNLVGNYAVLHTSTCITNGHKQIGDGFCLSSGAKLTTMETLGDHVTVAANSVVTKSWNHSHVLLAGMPATIKREQAPWYEYSESYKRRIEQIEQLKSRLF